MNIKKLRLLSTHLRTAEVADHWDYERILTGEDPLGCSSVGCAMGHAVAIEELGLRAIRSSHDYQKYLVTDLPDYEITKNMRDFTNHYSKEAMMRVFDLIELEVVQIFYNAGSYHGNIAMEYVTPAMVADVIDMKINEEIKYTST